MFCGYCIMDSSYLSSLLEIWDLEETSSTSTHHLIRLLDTQATDKSSMARANEREHQTLRQSPPPNHRQLSPVDVYPQDNSSSLLEPHSQHNVTRKPHKLTNNQYFKANEGASVFARENVECQHCFSENEPTAHWCTNCGTSLIARVRDRTTSKDLISNHVPRVHDMPRPSAIQCRRFEDLHRSDSEEEIPSCSVPIDIDTYVNDVAFVEHEETKEIQPVLDSVGNVRPASLNLTSVQTAEEKQNEFGLITTVKHRADLCVNNGDNKPLDLPIPDKTQAPSTAIPQRHWSTSGAYMWRKPSTLHRRLDLSTSDSLSKEDSSNVEINATSPSYVPALDLSAISLCTDNDSCVSRTGRQRSVSQSGEISLLESLPDEVLLHLMTYLAQKDLASCMRVCSRLYSIAVDTCLWKRVTLRKTSIEPGHFVSMVQRCPHLESLAFERCYPKIRESTYLQLSLNTFFAGVPLLKSLRSVLTDLAPGVRTGDKLILSAATHCPQLCSIELDWTKLSEEALQQCFKLISRLESLTIKQHRSISTPTLSLLFSKHGQWIQSLNISTYVDTSVRKILASTNATPVPNLHTFTGLFNKVDCYTIEYMQKVFPALIHLVPVHSTEFPVDVLTRLSKLPLRSLNLKQERDLQPFACDLIAQMHSLRELTLSCTSDEGFEALCKGQLSLEVLDLSNSWITLQSLQKIEESSFKLTLRKLDVNTSCLGSRDEAGKSELSAYKSIQL